MRVFAWRVYSTYSGPSTSTSAPSDFSLGFPLDFAIRLIRAVSVDVSYRPSETSPVPSSTFTAPRSPNAGEFLTAALQVIHRLHGLRCG